MGILNVTPDSFYDGGRYFSVQNAVIRARKIIEEGAHIIDIGGESSGPGSINVSLAKELRRVIPVIKKLTSYSLLISIDTYKSEVARQAIALGASMVNDVTALRGNPAMAALVARTGVKIVLMYSKDATARTTRTKKHYKDVVKTIMHFLQERIDYAHAHGIKKSQMIIDPGMGAFISSEPKYSYEILRRLSEFKRLGCPILVGTSRKSFIPGKVEDRLGGTIVASLLAAQNGADILRVHDVKEHKNVLQTLQKLWK